MAAALAVFLAGGALAYWYWPSTGSQNWYALGKDAGLAAQHRDAVILTSSVSQLARSCTADLNAAKPGKRPSAADKTAVEQWMRGCEAGYHRTPPCTGKARGCAGGYHGTPPCPGKAQPGGKQPGRAPRYGRRTPAGQPGQGRGRCGTSTPASTATTLSASPSPATAGQNVTLTATVTAADGSSPAGSVQFEADATAIGSPVTLSGDMASTTTTFAEAGTESLSAVFTPASTTAYKPSTGQLSLTVQAGTGSGTGSGTVPLAVLVPGAGSFTLTVAPGTVTLAVSGAAATSALNPITVTDTRNTDPGWSVAGLVLDFTGSGTAAGSTISGNQLGWVPTDTSLATGAVLGPTVVPGSPGLGSTSAVLASAAAGGGVGTSLLGANLTLAIPPAAVGGSYASALTVTAVTSLS